MALPLTPYERLKRYRERRSLEREFDYLSKRWPEGHEFFTARQWASRKRWYIYYARRREERASGFTFPRRAPRHWPSGPRRGSSPKRPVVRTVWLPIGW